FRKVPFLFTMDPGVNALVYYSMTLSRLGYPEQGTARALEAVDLAREIAHPFSLAFAIMQLGWLYESQRRWELAERTSAAALAAEQGDVAEARALIDRAIAEIERTDERLHEVEARRVRGELWAHGPGADDRLAMASLRQAIDVARSSGARLDGLRAATSLARLYARRGERDESRSLLAPLEAWFTEGP